MTNQHGHKLMSELLEAPIVHISPERVRSAALTLVERGSFQAGPWNVDDVREALEMLGIGKRELSAGMFPVSERLS